MLDLLGALPAIALLAGAERLMRGLDRPSRGRRVAALLLGAALIPVVARVEPSMSSNRSSGTLAAGAWDAFGAAAAVEEALKLLALVALLRRPGAGRTGGLLLALYVSMGFAGLENVHHLGDERWMGPFLRTLLRRSLLTVPMHAAAAGLAAAMLVRRRWDGRGPGLSLGLPLAIALHGAFDLCAAAPYLPGAAAPSWYRSGCAVALWVIPAAAIAALLASAARLRRSDLAGQRRAPGGDRAA